MFEIPGSNIVEVNITEDVVSGKDQPKFVRKSEYSDKNDDKSDQQTELDSTATRAKYNVFN